MKFRHLVLANLLRKKIRTGLTIGSFAVALFLFGILAVVRGVLTFQDLFAGADRLVVMSKVNSQTLPLSYRDRILRIPGVKQVTYTWWTPGLYQNDRIVFMQIAVEVENHRAMYPELIIPDEQWAAFVADREGSIVGKALAKRFHWKIGDRVPVRLRLLPGDKAWEFNIRGIYRAKRSQHDTSQFWYQRKLLEEKVPGIKGLAGPYMVRVANPDQAAQVAKAIDREFANSPIETRTNTENDFGASMAKQMGNVEFLILSIGGVVFFTLLLVTGNTMAIAVRERVGELAILKAVGFSDVFVLALVLSESLVVAALGGALGLGLAKLFSLRGDPTGGLLRGFYLPGEAIASGLALALLVGVIAGILPALSAMRLRVVQAMRRV